MLTRMRAWWRSLDEIPDNTDSPPGAAELLGALRHPSRIKCGSLSVYGDIFGGRVDNVHRVVGGELEPDGCVLLHFDGHETLRVWDPEGVHIGSDEFRIERASRVRWEWYSYGEPRTPENLYYEEHLVVGDSIKASSTANWYTPSFSPSLSRPAVELLDGMS